ncbi:hypothetical protein ASF36_18860 [Methylobacterium sp. Leaf90]|nr:hypothetical protein ASF36_18860 [Methylobacterium sp. Leaf90]
MQGLHVELRLGLDRYEPHSWARGRLGDDFGVAVVVLVRIEAYNYGRRPKTLRGLTPYEFICQAWTKQPARFRLDPSHHMPGPNSQAATLFLR